MPTPVVILGVLSILLSSAHPHSGTSSRRVGCQPSGSRSSGKQIVRFAGAVSIGQTFDQEIAPGLVFRLDESSTGEPGWTIRVVPTPANKFADYLAVASPPYHFRNPRYLDTAYNVSAEEAVAWSPREFFFVLNETDYLRAREAVEQLPGGTDEHERFERVWVETAKGHGWLCITDSTLSQPTGHGPRSILSLSFEVVMQLPRPRTRPRS